MTPAQLRDCTLWEYQCLLAGHAVAKGGKLEASAGDMDEADDLLDRAIAAGPIKG